MRRETWAGLDVIVAGGADREGGGEGPVVILCHGFGAPGDDLVALWRYLDVPREVRFVFPAAPLEMGWGDARAWWMIDLEKIQSRGAARDLGVIPDGMLEARAQLSGLVDLVEERLGVRSDQLVLGGFSQGAMLACDVTLQRSKNPAALVMLSGTLVAEAEWTARAAAHRGLPVFMSHGSQDPLLPSAHAERLRDLFVAAGLAVEWTGFRGAHEIPTAVLDKLGGFLTRVLERKE